MDVQVVGPSEDETIRARQENQRREQVKEALEWFTRSGAVMENGHFRFGSGDKIRHGRTYVNPRKLFNMAFVSKYMATALVDVMSAEIRQQVEIVAGPPTGGIIVARDLADFITTKRHSRKGPQLPDVEALFFSRDWNDVYTVHDSDLERLVLRAEKKKEDPSDFVPPVVRGRRVLLVDDVLHRGQTFASCAAALKEHGAEVIATAELIDRGLSVIPLDVPNFYVGQVDSVLYTVMDCPMCKARIPITRF